MILTAHQPDLLPYTGFFHKMAHADLFDVAIHDQFQNRGYQKRVMMRGRWASWRLARKPSLCPISEVILTHDAVREMWATIVGRYQGSRYWDREKWWLGEAFTTCPDHALWAANLHLMIAVRARLGIKTPLAIGLPPVGRGNDGLLDLCRQYGADVYLSGIGGREYMGDLHEFDNAGVKVWWVAHDTPTPDSILTVLMDHDDPLSVVMEGTT